MEFKLVVEALDYEKSNITNNDWTEVEIEGNDAVTSMSPKSIQCIGFKGQMIVSREEAMLIRHALDEYKQNLQKTLQEPSAGLEDEMFCYDQMHQIAKVLYDMTQNHPKETRKVLNDWLERF